MISSIKRVYRRNKNKRMREGSISSEPEYPGQGTRSNASERSSATDLPLNSSSCHRPSPRGGNGTPVPSGDLEQNTPRRMKPLPALPRAPPSFSRLDDSDDDVATAGSSQADAPTLDPVMKSHLDGFRTWLDSRQRRPLTSAHFGFFKFLACILFAGRHRREAAQYGVWMYAADEYLTDIEFLAHRKKLTVSSIFPQLPLVSLQDASADESVLSSDGKSPDDQNDSEDDFVAAGEGDPDTSEGEEDGLEAGSNDDPGDHDEGSGGENDCESDDTASIRVAGRAQAPSPEDLGSAPDPVAAPTSNIRVAGRAQAPSPEAIDTAARPAAAHMEHSPSPEMALAAEEILYRQGSHRIPDFVQVSHVFDLSAIQGNLFDFLDKICYDPMTLLEAPKYTPSLLCSQTTCLLEIKPNGEYKAQEIMRFKEQLQGQAFHFFNSGAKEDRIGAILALGRRFTYQEFWRLNTTDKRACWDEQDYVPPDADKHPDESTQKEDEPLRYKNLKKLFSDGHVYLDMHSQEGREALRQINCRAKELFPAFWSRSGDCDKDLPLNQFFH